MKAPERLYVEVCEDGIYAFPKPPFEESVEYVRADLVKQPVSDHHEIEVEFRGEKVTVSREFCRDGERNYSTSEQDDDVIWAALRTWCEKKGITAFELYPEQLEQPVEGLEEEIDKYIQPIQAWEVQEAPFLSLEKCARHFAEWGAKHLKSNPL